MGPEANRRVSVGFTLCRFVPARFAAAPYSVRFVEAASILPSNLRLSWPLARCARSAALTAPYSVRFTEERVVFDEAAVAPERVETLDVARTSFCWVVVTAALAVDEAVLLR